MHTHERLLVCSYSVGMQSTGWLKKAHFFEIHLNFQKILLTYRLHFFCLCLVTSSLTLLAFGQCFSRVLFIYKNFITMREVHLPVNSLFSVVVFKTQMFYKVV